jgi:hypothetical protein
MIVSEISEIPMGHRYIAMTSSKGFEAFFETPVTVTER